MKRKGHNTIAQSSEEVPVPVWCLNRCVISSLAGLGSASLCELLQDLANA